MQYFHFIFRLSSIIIITVRYATREREREGGRKREKQTIIIFGYFFRAQFIHMAQHMI